MIDETLTFLYGVMSTIPDPYRGLIYVALTAILVTCYALLIWRFYRFIARRDVITLNLAQYNQAEHPILAKVLGVGVYVVEYLVILPFLIFFWFAGFALVIFLILENTSIVSALNLAAAVIAAIRILAYYKTELAEEIAKLFPLTVLVVFITQANLHVFRNIQESLAQIPQFLGAIVYYFLFIAALELLMRILEGIFGSEEEN